MKKRKNLLIKNRKELPKSLQSRKNKDRFQKKDENQTFLLKYNFHWRKKKKNRALKYQRRISKSTSWVLIFLWKTTKLRKISFTKTNKSNNTQVKKIKKETQDILVWKMHLKRISQDKKA